jgi:hypothetical protein
MIMAEELLSDEKIIEQLTEGENNIREALASTVLPGAAEIAEGLPGYDAYWTKRLTDLYATYGQLKRVAFTDGRVFLLVEFVGGRFEWRRDSQAENLIAEEEAAKAAEKEARRPAHTPAEAQAIVDRVVESLGRGGRVETAPQEVCITGWRAAVVIPERKGYRLELSQALQDGGYGIVSVPYREDPDQAYHDIRGWLLAAE